MSFVLGHIAIHSPSIGVISAPGTGYGVPTGYAPSGHTAPAINHLPIVKPSYGPPVAYGPPVQHSYTAPAAPSHGYLPQKFNAALEGKNNFRLFHVELYLTDARFCHRNEDKCHASTFYFIII